MEEENKNKERKIVNEQKEPATVEIKSSEGSGGMEGGQKYQSEPSGEAKAKKELEKKEETKEKPEEKPKEEKSAEKKTEKKLEVKKPKKTEAIVNAKNLPISLKDSAAICRFVKGKKIENAIVDLEQVLKLKKAVPMRGEIPHKKGKGMMSGRFPRKASQNFLKLLKSLSANATYNGLEDPIVAEAIANQASRPYGRFGRWQRKRTSVKLKAMEVKKE